MGDLREKIQVGDRVTYKDYDIDKDVYEQNTIIITNPNIILMGDIIKIERPVYEVIAEVEEKKKPELLTEEERETLLDIIGNFNGYSCEKVYTICIERNRNATVTVNVGSRKLSNIGNIMVSNLSFDKLESNLAYTVKELGLENE